MSYSILTDVYLELGGVPLATPAFYCLDPMELRKPAQRRGTDLLIPGATGVRARRRRSTVSRRTLHVVVGGDFKWDGTPWPYPAEGFDENLQHLVAAITPANGLPITATLHLPDASTITGDVQVEEIDPEFYDVSALVTIDVSIPGGELS